jgi:ApbE superfamily uncharacterized protein (UPF0280 family)
MPRTYRRLVHGSRLSAYRVAVRETDLHIQTAGDLRVLARELTLTQRDYLEAFIQRHPKFLTTLRPWTLDEPAPAIVRDMVSAGRLCGVGPMAAVAGAIAEHVGQGLRAHSREVIVENGGDDYIALPDAVVVGLHAGRSPLSLQVGLRLECGGRPLGVCTSSGTFGHSLSQGRADAVCVVSDSCCLADAAATAIANRLRSAADLDEALAWARTIEGLKGVVAVIGRRMAMWGQVELVPLKPKKD